jgi:uncharacterized membrane protein YkoI
VVNRTTRKDETMKQTKQKIALAVGAVAATAAIGGGAYAVSSDDDGEGHPIPATAIDQAKAAALKATHGGKVTGTEVDDEDSTYEVEVTLKDGSQVDVQLDENFKVVGTDADGPDDGNDDAGER